MARGVLFKGLQDYDGAVVTDTKGQLKTWKIFYSELFSEKKVDQVLMKEILGSLEQRIQDGSRLEAGFSLEDLMGALQSFKKGKYPGLDGLPMEFYAQFCVILGPDLTSGFKEFDGRQQLPDSFRKGVVTHS